MLKWIEDQKYITTITIYGESKIQMGAEIKNNVKITANNTRHRVIKTYTLKETKILKKSSNI